MVGKTEALEILKDLVSKIDSGEINILVEEVASACVFCGNEMYSGDPLEKHAADCIYIRSLVLLGRRPFDT